ncbi:palmitoyltransferase [Geosmithia morbida]|uniref:Palmitoyltransferase n=1 Tax=Geosmithia morbida TaxID=1094350 RepID=A0A9P4YPW8_9HYPO|nr:palmitoyltransferase [Geosmithia morbida]KAF4119860.1 palmitoyltransferase [Geosmithia morbida]
MPGQLCNERQAERWTARVIPFFILGLFGLGTYAVVARICIDYLYRHKGQHGTAVALLALHFVFLFAAIPPYVRTVVTTQRNPGSVGFNDRRQAAEDQRRALPKRERQDVEAQNTWTSIDQDPDSPGLEAFYTKDVFVCEADGRPRWCALCWNWKPDRAHHSSQLGRCVRKMDHFCPWVGGMVAETSFNFFFQFTFHATLYASVCLGASAYALSLQVREGMSLDGRVVAALVVAALFGFFALGMTLSSGRYILENKTNIDALARRQQFYLAIRVPLDTPSAPGYWTVTYPLPRPSEVPELFDDIQSRRDHHARRTFAIVQTQPGENPWDLGVWRNVKSVLGSSPLEWLLPIRHSPCCRHDSPESDYEMNDALMEKLHSRYNLPRFRPESAATTATGAPLREKAA